MSSRESLLRAIRPEAEVTLDGQPFSVGGLTGQPIENYLLSAWLPKLQSDPAAFWQPLDQHRDHYARRLANFGGAGVQACFRGPRLYDTDATREVVQQGVRFYRQHQEILNSDLIPLRRADGRDWDGWLHVHPAGRVRALAMIYNPLQESIERKIQIPLYYTGARGSIHLSIDGQPPIEYQLDDQHRVQVTVNILPQGHVTIIEQSQLP